jgi:hypothetical protein
MQHKKLASPSLLRAFLAPLILVLLLSCDISALAASACDREASGGEWGGATAHELTLCLKEVEDRLINVEKRDQQNLVAGVINSDGTTIPPEGGSKYTIGTHHNSGNYTIRLNGPALTKKPVTAVGALEAGMSAVPEDTDDNNVFKVTVVNDKREPVSGSFWYIVIMNEEKIATHQ